MKNLLIALFCFCFMFVSTATAQSDGSNVPAAKTNTGKKTKPSKQNKNKKAVDKPEFACELPASVTAVNLRRTEVSAVCPPNNSCTQIIEVKVTAIDDEHTKYIYTVSGGKIIGSGANVSWDLSGVKSGTYIITVGIDSGQGVLGMARTKEIKVVE